jgi:cytoskeletal protein RodZ
LTAVTTDFGGKLRTAREARGISLRQIAATTKISVPALEALERNDISRLPGGIFSRAIVRSYAVEVGLDPEVTVHEFLQRFHETPGIADVHPRQVPSQDEQRKHHAAWVFLAALAGMLLVGSIVGLVVYQMRPVDSGAAAPVPERSAQPPSDDPAVTPTSTAAEPVGTSAATESGELRLELHPTAACWASVVIDGKKVVSRLFQPGERETVLVRGTAVLTVGDAGACTFSINGRPARPLGSSGQVRSARISQARLAELFY